MSLTGFLAALGSKNGAPGGGAAAALTGATGAALVEMVARLNDVRLKRSSGTARKAAALRAHFQRLILEDARAFGQIQKAYKLRKKNPARWQGVLKSGAKTPFKIGVACVAASALAVKERPRTSAWLESDRKESLILLGAAFRAAVLNIEVNLKGMSDRGFKQKMRKDVSQCRRRIPRS